MKPLYVSLLVAALAACADAGPTDPGALPAFGQSSGPSAGPALLDALDRISPTLGSSPSAVSVQDALAAAVRKPNPRALTLLDAALTKFEAEQPDAAVEATVIRLAIDAQR